jgi:hypothetical protein
MEVRATINTASVSRTFLAAVLVLVAMGLAAMAGYAAKGAFGGSASVSNIAVGHPAAGTVLRQDDPARGQAELPSWLGQELAGQPAAAPIIVDDPSYYDRYLIATPAPEPRSTGHGNLP